MIFLFDVQLRNKYDDDDDAMARCPSVRLSVTFVHSIQTVEDIVKLLCRSHSPIILVFDPLAPMSNSKGNPFSGGAKYKGWENFAIYD